MTLSRTISTILVLAMLCAVGVAEADTEISSCQVISAPGNYRLTNDILDATPTCCIEITADDVCLDCMGHTIDGDGTGYQGIYVSRTSETDSNITIRNGTVQNWKYADIFLQNANNNLIEDMTVLDSNYAGIQLRSTKRNNLTDITANGNSENGIYLYNTYNTHLTNISASDNDAGIHFSYAAYNWLNDSNLIDNSRVDMEVTATDPYWCPNYLSNVTGSGGRPIGYYYDSTTIQDLEFSELLLCNADNAIISNVSVHGTDNEMNNGINVLLTDDASFSDIRSIGNDHGITFKDSSNNTMTGITAEHNEWNGLKLINSHANQVSNSDFSSNSHHGIYLNDNSSQNKINDVVANWNRYNGIYLQDANHNNISNSEVHDNSQGINLVQDSSYNTIMNTNANANKFCSLYICNNGLGSPTHNTINTITANLNEWHGIYINGASSTTIKNSHIENNGKNGIYLRGIPLGETGANQIYNNIVTNPQNIHVSYDVTHATLLNTTITTGPNIIGGPKISGNYWSDYTGTDNNNDGFGDTPYTINSLDMDHNPLVHIQATCGDVVPDGNINILDLTELLNIVVAGDTIDPCIGDTDGDRNINILDVRRLIMYINDPAGSPLNCGC